jgi:hypothetical protein
MHEHYKHASRRRPVSYLKRFAEGNSIAVYRCRDGVRIDKINVINVAVEAGFNTFEHADFEPEFAEKTLGDVKNGVVDVLKRIDVGLFPLGEPDHCPTSSKRRG